MKASVSQNPKFETRSPKEVQKTKPQIRTAGRAPAENGSAKNPRVEARQPSLGLRSSGFLRISELGFRPSGSSHDRLFRPDRILAGLLILSLLAAFTAAGQTSRVIGWGWNNNGQANPPPGISNAIAVTAGGGQSLALRANGTVIGWGFQPAVPAGLDRVLALDSSGGNSLALRSDGTLIAWGSNLFGQNQTPAGLSNVIAISAGNVHTLALRADGTVAAWGDNDFGQTNVPPGLTNVIAISAGGGVFTAFSLALKSDGTIVAWGDNRTLQTIMPPGLSNVVAIAASPFLHSLALKSDGTVVAWGVGGSEIRVPRGLSNVVAIAAGSYFSMALRADGTVVAWGDSDFGQSNVPAAARNVTAIAAGTFHNLAVARSTPAPWPRITQQPQSVRAFADDTVVVRVTATSTAPLSYRWQFRGQDVANETNDTLVLNAIQLQQAGDYAVIVSSDGLSVRSAPAFVSVHKPPVAHPQAVTAPEDTEVLIAVTGSDPKSLPLAAKITGLPGAGRLFQYTSRGRGDLIDAVPTIITDPEWRLIYVPNANAYGQPLDTFVVKMTNEIGDSAPGKINVYITPVNDPPMALVQVISPSLLSATSETEIALLAPNDVEALVLLDASLSMDVEGDALQYEWFLEGEAVPFATGTRATNLVAVGLHRIVLQVRDSSDVAMAVLELEVLTAAEATEALVQRIEEAPVLRRSKLLLLLSLKSAIISFERRQFLCGLQQLRAFQNKVRTSVAPKHADLARELVQSAQQIIDALTARSEPAAR